jgi:tetratricopeptide (TPR) repeat protein
MMRSSSKSSDKQPFLLGKSTGVGEASMLVADASRQQPHSEPTGFQQSAMDRLATAERFGLIAIQISVPEPVEASNPEKDGATDVQDMALAGAGDILSAFCSQEGAFWGKMDQGIVACVLPGADTEACRRLAQDLCDRLGQQQLAVTMGLAVYPVLDFSPGDTFDNGRKALQHAAFFGHGSQVLFDDVSLNVSGDEYYDQGEILGAMVEYRRGLALNPDNANLHNSLGVCHGVLGSLEKALEQFEAAARLDPGETMAHYNAGLVHLQMGDRHQARQKLQVAADQPEPIFEVLLQLGALHLEDERPALARPLLEKATAVVPDSAVGLRTLGQCYLQLDMISDAVGVYKRAVRESPNDAESLSALGYLLDLQGERSEISMIFCRQSVEIEPRNGLFRYRLGQLYFHQELLQEALDQFNLAAELGYDCSERIDTVRNRLVDMDAGLEN